MPDFINDLGLLASQNYFLAYFIFYIAVMFLGTIAEFTGFWLVFKGFFGPWGLLVFPAVVILSSASGDLLWYSFGGALKETRFGNFVKNRLPKYAELEESLKKNGTNLIFMARFVYGSALPIIFSIGWFGMGLQKFFKMSFISNCIWVPILTGIAYGLTLGLTPLQSVAVFREFEIAFLVGIVSFLILSYLATKLVKYIFSLLGASPRDTMEEE